MNEKGFSLIELLVATVILLGALGIATQIFVQGNNAFTAQRDYDDARSNAAASLDMTVRLLRSARTIAADPDGNLTADSIRIIGDWNPADGDSVDPYENVLFTVNNGTLFKQEPADAGPVAFADRIASMSFVYRNAAGTLLPAPWAVNPNQLAFVAITMNSTPINGVQVVVTSSASIRRHE